MDQLTTDTDTEDYPPFAQCPDDADPFASVLYPGAVIARASLELFNALNKPLPRKWSFEPLKRVTPTPGAKVRHAAEKAPYAPRGKVPCDTVEFLKGRDWTASGVIARAIGTQTRWLSCSLGPAIAHGVVLADFSQRPARFKLADTE